MLQVDDEMRCLLDNLKAMVAAEAAAKSGGAWLKLAAHMAVDVQGRYFQDPAALPFASGHCLTGFSAWPTI